MKVWQIVKRAMATSSSRQPMNIQDLLAKN